jgi:condensin complex subunit 2
MPTLDKTMTLEISDTLSSFRFSSDPNSMPGFTTLVGLKDTYADDGPSMTMDDYAPTGEAHDFFGGEDYDMGAGPGAFDDGASVGGYDDAAEGFAEGPYAGPSGGVGMAAPGDVHAPFDPRRQGTELVMALVGGGGEEEGMFDYFDKGFGKSWAGAEHWKLRKVSRKGESSNSRAGIQGC